MKRVLSHLLVAAPLLACAACGASEPAQPPATTAASTAIAPASATPTAPAPTASAAEAPKPPKLDLGETPADKLGTSPAGFGLPKGTKAPDATLTDVSGKTQKLSDLYKVGPTYVIFYRGGWCPFCNLQMHQLSEAKPDFDKKGIKLVAISVDLPTEEAKMQAKDGVPFPMLSDPKMVSLTAFKVVHNPSDEEQKALKNFGVDLQSYSGESHHKFAAPAVFLVDKTGTIVFSHVDEDFKTRPSPKQLLAVADTALKK